jgi:hypothetical protein
MYSCTGKNTIVEPVSQMSSLSVLQGGEGVPNHWIAVTGDTARIDSTGARQIPHVLPLWENQGVDDGVI